MTKNTQPEDSEMKEPVLEGSEGGAPEESESQDSAPATAKEEDTSDQESTTDDSLDENERLEKERKMLARTASDKGRQAKEAKLAALDAVASLDDEKAKAFLESHPELQEEFLETYPDRNLEEVKPSTKAIDEELITANVLARTAKAAEDQEHESTSVDFAVANGLKQEQIDALKKTAKALVTADKSTPFTEALSIVYQNKYGKAPEETLRIPTTSGTKEQSATKEDLDWWGKNVSSDITGKSAEDVQKGADEYHKQLTHGRPQ